MFLLTPPFILIVFIIQDEIKNRRDLRDLIVFSIDPPNCQDIDGIYH